MQKQNMEVNLTESNSPVSFFITGFGPFGEVTENPTSVIIKCLQTERNAHNPKLRHVYMLDVVRVAASSVRQQVHLIMEQVNKHIKNYTKQRHHVVLLHLGVNHQRRTSAPTIDDSKNHKKRQGQKPVVAAFQLEQNAFNEANFRIPDDDGWKPKHEKISVEKELGLKLSTDLNVKNTRDGLIQKGFDVCISGDAGRFLCNYIYWESLNMLTAVEEEGPTNNDGGNDPIDCNLHSLFVHFPNFEYIPMDVQVAFTMELLESISKSIICRDKKKRKH